MQKLKIILAGTPNFSVPIFQQVIQNFDVLAIISQPDKPANRGYKLEPTPSKLLAEKYNIPLFQPNKISEIYGQLSKLDFDILLTCAFGQMIPEKVLALPKLGALNVHGSLLPKYRGAAPIQYSLLNGDSKTGITLMYMVKAMDAGDMITKVELDIQPSDTADILFEKLSHLAANNIVAWLNNFANGKYIPVKQDDAQVTFSPKLNKEDALLSPELDIDTAFNKIRAFSSNPGAYYMLNGKRVKIYYATKEKKPNGIKLDFANGFLWAIDYQFETKKRVKLV
ncbi:methionyl-tRNA formyltransferase [Mycoplasmopsis verecunda]|uniref:Methionyl-tRNA formyltransferase n=1 Tax=Mycoplasmopsis verecunda TaxID=171291 RepID=A0A1T4KD88_9BACT|nr:methionyl-tRNA formyltransferase [Mycoplasmopsis verecunda]WPB54858.1 methionyl-tRNA formyltransferase [Mycoplasmopsis verecunda]SJZ40337.1 methionyl-tRNA formyltransferase [Mycoplasmopsis verecunda]